MHWPGERRILSYMDTTKEAQKQADRTRLPQTVYGTNHPDMPHFVRAAALDGSGLCHPTNMGRRLRLSPLVTVLPTRYFA